MDRRFAGEKSSAKEARLARRLLLIAVLLTLSRTAAAYGGELSTRITIDNEVAAVRHPLAAYGDSRGTFIYVPRFGALLGYGVANWLELGVGGSASLSRDLEAQNVRYQGALGNLHASYWDILVPAQLALHFETGTDHNWRIAFSGGPAFVHWSESAMFSRDNAHTLAINPGSAWYLQWFLRAAIMYEWRPVNWFALQAGPYGGYTTGGDIHAGAQLVIDFSFGAGPSF